VGMMVNCSQNFVQEKAKIRMMQQKDSGKSNSYWDDLWAKPKEYRDSGENQLRLTDQPG